MTSTRPTLLVIGIVLLIIISLGNFIPFSLPEGEEGPPQFIIYLGYLLAVLGLIAAAGLWLRMKWALILAIVASVLGILSALPGVFFAPTTLLQVMATIGVVAGVIVIVLLLLPTSRQSLA